MNYYIWMLRFITISMIQTICNRFYLENSQNLMDISRMKRQQLKIKLNPIYYTENKNNIFTLPCRYWDWKSKNQETYRSVGLNIFGPTLTSPTPFSSLHYFTFATSMNSLLHSRPSWWASRHSYPRPLVSSQRRKKVHVSCPVRPLKLVHPTLLWLRLLENLADFALFSSLLRIYHWIAPNLKIGFMGVEKRKLMKDTVIWEKFHLIDWKTNLLYIALWSKQKQANK